MSFDFNLVDQRVVTLDSSATGADLLQALCRPDSNYVILADQLRPDDQVRVFSRNSLFDALSRKKRLAPAARRKWAGLLREKPGAFTTFVATTLLFDNETFQDPEASSSSLAHISKAFEDWMSSTPGHPAVASVVQAEQILPMQWPELSVILLEDRLAGIFDEKGLSFGAWRGAPKSAGLQSLARATRTEGAFAQSVEPGVSGCAAGRDAILGEVLAAQPPFIAHPRLTPQAEALPGGTLAFVAGFADKPDPDADEQKRIRIDEAEPGETMLVVVSAEGAAIEGEVFAELVLNLAAEHRFVARVDASATRVILRAQYLFRNKLVGSIIKTLACCGAAISTQPLSFLDASAAPTREDAVLPLPAPATIEGVDLILWVQKECPGFVAWSAYAPRVKAKVGPISVKLDDAGQFAKSLAGLRNRYGDSGTAAWDELTGVGGVIAALIPTEILKMAIRPVLGGTEPPWVLILTDDAFVPWELARLSPQQSGLAEHAFLGALACIGRWWSGETSSGPPSDAKIVNLSAVAASKYDLASGRKTLTFAIAERDALTNGYKEYNAKPVEARRSEVDAWLDRNPRLPGHLAHMALHGYGDALADSQGLVLGDNWVITPHRLAGEWDVGETPRFTAVFLNACQVGSGGEKLGRISGFPGALVAGGVSAFIAPLWEVEDEVAAHVSEAFYKRTLTEHVEVGEALREQRAETGPERSITPLAYIFYGHPRLRFSGQAKDSSSAAEERVQRRGKS